MQTHSTTRGVGITELNGPIHPLELSLRHSLPTSYSCASPGAGAGLWDLLDQGGLLGDGPLPRALGSEGAGTVEAVGTDVHHLGVGDAVLSYVPMGGFHAERVVVDRIAHCARTPPDRRSRLSRTIRGREPDPPGDCDPGVERPATRRRAQRRREHAAHQAPAIGGVLRAR